MKSFARLFSVLENATDPVQKKTFFREYVCAARESDRMWAVALLLGRKPRRVAPVATLKEWALEAGNVSPWLFEESLLAVGELAETISLILPAARYPSRKSLSQWMTFLYSLEELNEYQQRESVLAAWDEQEPSERLLFIKLLAGSFRSPLAEPLLIEALAQLCNVEKTWAAHQLAGDWHPHGDSLEDLLSATSCPTVVSQPYPFFLAHQLEASVADLGDVGGWLAEWKWDGIRAQVVKRNGELFVWSRGEELVTDKFPELAPLRHLLPDGTVLDGELVAFAEGHPLPYGSLHGRLSRKTLPSAKALKESPVVLIAYDLLEWSGADIRREPCGSRRERLENLVATLRPDALLFSDALPFDNWAELLALHDQARAYFAEGIMLKRKDSPYQMGRRRGDWWKWRADPFTLDGVLMYAQKPQPNGQEAFPDLTFGLWDNGQLVPFARIPGVLPAEELEAISLFVRDNTLEKFGPVRTVKPELVFEIAFQAVETSARHKAGLSVRFPQLVRWRRDKPVEEASTLTDLRGLLRREILDTRH
jgi:DNA ligase-1